MNNQVHYPDAHSEATDTERMHAADIADQQVASRKYMPTDWSYLYRENLRNILSGRNTSSRTIVTQTRQAITGFLNE